MSRQKIFFFTCLSLIYAFQLVTTAAAQNYLDSINFGDKSSEKDHGLRADSSETLKGAVRFTGKTADAKRPRQLVWRRDFF